MCSRCKIILALFALKVRSFTEWGNKGFIEGL